MPKSKSEISSTEKMQSMLESSTKIFNEDQKFDFNKYPQKSEKYLYVIIVKKHWLQKNSIEVKYRAYGWSEVPKSFIQGLTTGFFGAVSIAASFNSRTAVNDQVKLTGATIEESRKIFGGKGTTGSADGSYLFTKPIRPDQIVSKDDMHRQFDLLIEQPVYVVTVIPPEFAAKNGINNGLIIPERTEAQKCLASDLQMPAIPPFITANQVSSNDEEIELKEIKGEAEERKERTEVNTQPAEPKFATFEEAKERAGENTDSDIEDIEDVEKLFNRALRL